MAASDSDTTNMGLNLRDLIVGFQIFAEQHGATLAAAGVSGALGGSAAGHE
jgi:hypothetical protein